MLISSDSSSSSWTDQILASECRVTPACELVPEAVCLLLTKFNLVPWELQRTKEKLKYERPEEGVPGVGVLVDRFLRVLLQLLDSWNTQVQRILHLTALSKQQGL